jgi:hypothetical protein
MSPVLSGPEPVLLISPCILDCRCGVDCGTGEACGTHKDGSYCHCSSHRVCQ